MRRTYRKTTAAEVAGVLLLLGLALLAVAYMSGVWEREPCPPYC